MLDLWLLKLVRIIATQTEVAERQLTDALKYRACSWGYTIACNNHNHDPADNLEELLDENPKVE